MFDPEKYPFRYRAFGLNVHSQITVTGFESIPVETADVIISEGIVPDSLERAVNKCILFESNESELLLRIEKAGTFYIRNGREIIIKRNHSASYGEVSSFITGISFGALLHQRKLLPLHACTVQFKNKCLVIAGLSGSGKTTLALGLIKSGGILVADDISVIAILTGKPFVLPAYPAIKIWEDSLAHFGISSAGLKPVRENLKKYYLPISPFNPVNSPVDHIFVLNTHNKSGVSIKHLLGFEKFSNLKRFTYLFRGIPKTILAQNHFVLCSQLAAQVPVSVLTRPLGEFSVNELVNSIAEII
jgi:hypothetical protein